MGNLFFLNALAYLLCSLYSILAAFHQIFVIAWVFLKLILLLNWIDIITLHVSKILYKIKLLKNAVNLIIQFVSIIHIKIPSYFDQAFLSPKYSTK